MVTAVLLRIASEVDHAPSDYLRFRFERAVRVATVP